MVETIFTIGHSTRSIDEFIRILHSHGVRRIVDVRTIAKSRHNPQFGEDALGPSLAEQGIGYERFEVLGGLRHTNSHSVNGAWRNASFRGYADYMQTPKFVAGIDELIALGAREVVAIMCAEAVPWRCHRSLIADALLVRGIDVLDIMSEKGAKPHAMTRFAQVDGLTVTYPPEPGQEAGETAHASPEAGNAEAGNAENGNTENGNTEAGNAESGNTEAANAENGNAESGKAENGSTEAGNAGNGDTEAGIAENGSTENGSTENGNTETARTERLNSDIPSTEEPLQDHD